MLDIKNGWVAYCLDNAIWEFGRWVEDELDKVPKAKTDKTNNARRKAKLKALLTGDEAKAYADPAALFGKG